VIPARNLASYEPRDKRISIQSLGTTQDSTTGIVTEGWTTFATLWATIEPLTAREFLAAAATQSKVTARITIDYIAGVLPSMRVVHGTHTYKIEGPPLESAKTVRELILMVSEVSGG